MFVAVLLTLSFLANKFVLYSDLTQNFGSACPDIKPCVVSTSKKPLNLNKLSSKVTTPFI